MKNALKCVVWLISASPVFIVYMTTMWLVRGMSLVILPFEYIFTGKMSFSYYLIEIPFENKFNDFGDWLNNILGLNINGCE